ncbi:MAG: NUDIX domain-containing protein [Bacteroidota bacterium]
MYKIYINKTAIILTEKDGNFNPIPGKNKLIANYIGRRKHLLHYIDMAEKGNHVQEVILVAKDLPQLKADFFGVYKILEAAGGLVFNQAGEILVMYRRGSWDLPKGKIDKGESVEEAAVREVMEETGLKEVTLGDKHFTSYHTYQHPKHGRVLKPTYWFKMTSSQQELIPQTEEDIEQMKWMKKEDFLEKYQSETYQSILDVLMA